MRSVLVVLALLLFPAVILAQVIAGGDGGSGDSLSTLPEVACTNQAVIALHSDGTISCASITPAYVGSGIALTGVDINTSHQVTVTHLSSPLPVTQGGMGITAGVSGGIPYYSSAGTIASSGPLAHNAPVLGGGPGNPPTTGTLSGSTLELGTILGAKSIAKQLTFDANGNIIASVYDIGPASALAASAHQLAYYATDGTTVSGLSAPPTLNRYLKGTGTDWSTSSMGAAGAGSCTNQAVIALNSDAAPTCATITSAYVNSSIAQTGVDLNSSHQVVATHLASPLPVTQGGTGFANTTYSGTTHGLPTYSGSTTTGKQLTYDASGNVIVSAYDVGPAGGGTVTQIQTTSPLTGGPITGSGTIGIADAAADGSTKGVVAFVASDFNCSSGICSLDYSMGQSASASAKGFLSATDWSTFNAKQNALGYTAEDSANKSTNTALGTSNTLYPTVGAVKSYVDTAVATAAGTITAVGTCTGGACFTTGSPSTSLTFNNAATGTITLQAVGGPLGSQTLSLPAETGTLCSTGSVCPGYQAAGTYVLQATTITINGTSNEITASASTQDLSANRTWNLSLPSLLALSGKTLTGGSPLVFDGATPDSNKTSVVVTDPTTSRTFTLPNADSVAVQPNSGASNQFVTAISTLGVVTLAQPAFSNLSGTATAAQLPNPTTSLRGGVQAKDCTGMGHILSINADSTVTCSADAGASGGLGDPGSNGVVVRTSSGTTMARTLTGTTNQITITNGTGVSGNPTFSLPQSIDTAATVRFGTLGLGVAAPSTAGQLSLVAGANNITLETLQRNTDTSPTGNFAVYQNAAGTALWTVDITGSLSVGTVPVARLSGTVAFANGGTGVSSAADDTLLVSSGSAWVVTAIPNCADTGGQHLNYTAASNSFSCGTSGGGGTLSASGTPTSGQAAEWVSSTALQGVGTTGSGSYVKGTSPTITTPTGIVKGDVGLGNVDNTSDATKNSAVVTLTNKTLDNTTTLDIKDTLFTLQDNGGSTKKAQFELSSISAGQTRSINIPDANSTTIQADTGSANNFLTAVSAQGVISKARPTCANLSDSSGGCAMSTTAGGDLSGTLPSPTVAKINGTAFAGTTGNLVDFAASNTPHDSGVATANVPLLNAANVFTSATGQSVKKLLLPGSTSGTLTIVAAATAGTNTLTFPAGTTDFSATGGTSQVLKQTSTGGAITVAQLAASDLSNGTSGSGAVILATGATLNGVTLAQNVNMTGTLTPTALSGNQDNYNPTNLSTASTLRIDGGAADRNITGLSGGTDGRIILIANIGTSNSLVLKNQDGGSTAANRFAMAADLPIPFSTTVALRYDGTSMRWRPWTDASTALGAHVLTTQAETGLTAETNLGALTSGMLKHTVSGAVSTPATAVAGTDYVAPATTITINGTTNRVSSSAGAQDLSTNRTWTIDIPSNAQLSIAKLTNLTTNGFVKTSASDGTLSVDTTTYLTANQTITLSGDVTGSGTTSITTTVSKATGNFAFAGTLSPTALTGNVNDYNPTNLSTALALRIDGGAADRNITGLAGGADGRIITITNIGTSNALVLKNQDSGSTAANRFLLGSDLVLGKDAPVALRYDNTTQRWRPWSTLGGIGLHTLAIPGTAWTACATNGATPSNVETATNKNNYAVMDFGKTSGEVCAQVKIPFPKSYNHGTFTFQPYFLSTASGAVVWKLQCVAVNTTDAFDVAYGTAQSVTASASASGKLIIGSASAAITPAGTNGTDSLMDCRLFRDGGNGSDTNTGTARLTAVKIAYSTNANNDN